MDDILFFRTTSRIVMALLGIGGYHLWCYSHFFYKRKRRENSSCTQKRKKLHRVWYCFAIIGSHICPFIKKHDSYGIHTQKHNAISS